MQPSSKRRVQTPPSTNHPTTTKPDTRSTELHFLQVRIPDRIGVYLPDLIPDDRRTINKSLVSSWARELAMTIVARYPAAALKVRHWLNELPGQFLASILNVAAISDAFDRIDAAVHDIEHPPQPEPLPTAWLEIAKDHRLTLARDRERAALELERLLARLAHENPRAAAPLELLAKAQLHGDPAGALARWMRAAVVGYGFTEPRRDDLVYSGALPPLPALSALPKIDGPHPITVSILEAVAPKLGIDLAAAIAAERHVDPNKLAWGGDSKRLLELQRLRDAKKLVAVPAGAMNGEELNQHAYEVEAAKVRAADQAARRQLSIDVAEAPERVRYKVVAALDRKIVELARVEPCSLKMLWLRDARHAIANIPGHAPLFMPQEVGVDHQAARALDMVAALGMRLEFTP